jgi:hypothetical protein
VAQIILFPTHRTRKPSRITSEAVEERAKALAAKNEAWQLVHKFLNEYGQDGEAITLTKEMRVDD